MKLGKALSLTLLASFSLLIFACSKNDSVGGDGKARMQIFLTDDPGEYEAVFIDVEGIEINYSTDPNSGWQPLQNVNTGEYDLLKLVNDDDTMLADAELKTGRIEQIRLKLGSENYELGIKKGFILILNSQFLIHNLYDFLHHIPDHPGFTKGIIMQDRYTCFFQFTTLINQPFGTNQLNICISFTLHDFC